jgi:hypothetical protein
LNFLSKIDKNNPSYVGTLNVKGDEYVMKVDQHYESDKNKGNLDEKVWMVIKSSCFKEGIGYRLREGDYIKLGKVIFKVREIQIDESLKDKRDKKPLLKKTSGFMKDKTMGEMVIQGQVFANNNNEQIINNGNNMQSNPFGNNINTNLDKIKKKSNPICRICLMDDNEKDNPLVNPCHCIGSVRFIHILCLRRWLKSKVTTKNFNFLLVHSFKSFDCELCKTVIPEKIKYRNEIISLIDFQKPESNFIMLESISREKRETRYLYIIHIKDKYEIKLGRANDSDVRMTDISVSRNHAFLKLYQGYFYLEDNSSKFGTLAQIQSDVIFIPNKQIALQSGKLYMLFNLRKTFFSVFCCYNNKYLTNLDYNDYFENQEIGKEEKEAINSVIYIKFLILNID